MMCAIVFRQFKQLSGPKISWYVLVPVILKVGVSMPLEVQVDVSVPLEQKFDVSPHNSLHH